MIKGITVTLFNKTPAGKDDYGDPIYEETGEAVENILVSPVSSSDNIDNTNLYGKTATYQLGIPKGDAHTWEDRRVRFFGADWHTFGFVYAGIDANVPTAWNAKVQVERYG